jgi:hypothetical protein
MSKVGESKARPKMTHVHLKVARVGRLLCNPVSATMAQIARNAAADHRNPVDVRVGKDLGVKSKARSHCSNEASARKTWNNESTSLDFELALLCPRGQTPRRPMSCCLRLQPKTRTDWNRPTSKTKQC